MHGDRPRRACERTLHIELGDDRSNRREVAFGCGDDQRVRGRIDAHARARKEIRHDVRRASSGYLRQIDDARRVACKGARGN